MFETERLIIRPLEGEQDINALMHAHSDPYLMSFLSSGPLIPMTRDQTVEMLKRRDNPYHLPFFCVCEKTAEYEGWPRKLPVTSDISKDQPPVIGFMSFQPERFDFKNRSVKIGLSIVREQHRGKGYGNEMLQWLLEYGFMDLGLHRIALEVYSSNEPALKLYRKIGFVEEGRQRKTCWSKGVWYDTYIMSFLEEEWYERRKMLGIKSY